ncbi:MEDS domain-containing protein [Phytohabitans sp. ZYX-F-186]|uniref:MEDS domain-containing protein n=1 Tax=Phytohabitans maris TaxID=3071409 RepID=A0ABU0ZUJ3_9ACTN|nr:MEDS domain-containing protein [Phytohabitans sp. ZYX-F-186]MDQ7910699.1 MEDS domain-containing protein [Phytohabitans sp. ZYX-F-186]
MASAAAVDDLRPGDHACLTYSDADERLDIVAAFVRDGLGAGQRIICFTDPGGPPDLADELAERDVKPTDGGQLTIRDNDTAWLAGGRVSATNVIEMLAHEVAAAHRDGFAGLRVTADMCWATRPVAAVDELLVFETRVAGLFAGGRLTAVCQYDRQSFDPVTLAFAAKAHPRAVAAAVYHEDPLLRICRQHAPPGVRLAGEIDYRRVPELNQALAEALRLGGDIHVNLAHLRFMDAAAAAAVGRAALSLQPGRAMVIVCRRAVRKVLDLVGVTDQPAVRVRQADGR